MAKPAPTRTAAWVKSRITELENAMVDIYSDQRGFDDVVNPNAARIINELPEELKHKLAVVNKDYSADLALEVGNLDQAHEIHVDPLAAGRRADTQADTLEDILASLMIGVDLGPGSPYWHTIRAGYCHNMFVPIWLEQDKYSPPTRMDKEGATAYNTRVDRYNAEWSPWHITIDPVEAVSFLDRQGEITLAGRHLKIPVSRVIDDYGDWGDDKPTDPTAKDARAFQICGEQFPYLRGGDSIPAQNAQSSFWNREIEVWVIDDGVTITHHIQRPDTQDYDEVDSYPNIFGMVSLIVLSGAFEMSLPTWMRRRPLHEGLLNKYEMIMKSESLVASYNASSMVDRALSLDPEPAAKWLGMEEEEREAFSIDRSAGSMPVLPGHMEDMLGHAEAAKNELVRLQQLYTQLQPLKPNSPLSGPDAAAVVEYAKAASVLYQAEALGHRLQMPINEDSRLIYLLCTMMLNAWFATVNPHYTRGSGEEDDKLDVSLTRSLSGQEQVFGRVTVKGQSRSLTPAAADFAYRLKVESRDTRLSTRAAIAANAHAQWDTLDGVKLITFDKYLEAVSGETNITALKIALQADSNYQLGAPAAMQMVTDQMNHYAALFIGADPQLIEQQHAVAVDPNAAPAPTAGGANPSNNQQIPAQAPHVPQPGGNAS